MYYKKKHDELLKENKILKDNNASLTNKLKILESKANKTLRDKYNQEYTSISHFCKQDQVDFYFDEDFEDKLKEVTKHLNPEEKYYYKYIYLRGLFVNFIRKDNFSRKMSLDNKTNFWNLKETILMEIK